MISAIKTIIQGMGLSWSYGNPSQINYYLQNTDYSASADGITAFCYLITESAYVNGKERATIAVFFSKLMPFDFNGDQAIQVIDDCKDKAKQFLNIVANGNVLNYTDARFQCGYDDYAENVGWCAVRATFEMMQADCWNIPDYRPTKVYISQNYMASADDDNVVNYVIVVFTDKPTQFPVEAYWNYDKIESVVTISEIFEDISVEELRDYIGGRSYLVEFSVPIFHDGSELGVSVGGVMSNTLFIQHE